MTCRRCLIGRLQIARFSSASEKQGRVCYNVSKRTEKGQHSQGNTTCSRSDFNASLSFQYFCQPGPGYVRESPCSGPTDLFDHVSHRTVLCLQSIQVRQHGQLTFTHNVTECILGDQATRNEDATCNATGPSFECQCGRELIFTRGLKGQHSWWSPAKVFQVNSSVIAQNTSVCRTSNLATRCLCDTCVNRGEDGRCISVNKSGPSGSRHSPSLSVAPTGKDECQCMDGFEFKNSKHCTNINECALGTHNCSSNANCMDANGTYHCQCFHGYTGNGRTSNCTNINECARKTHNCSTNANCTDTNGSFNCQCFDGYTGNGKKCANINECTRGTHNCSANANCMDTNGTFHCQCFEGFTENGRTKRCMNINECNSPQNNCSANTDCSDTEGSYQCVCKGGFTNSSGQCTNIDECALQIYRCSPNATCNDTLGSYECHCKKGFYNNSMTCVNTNECTSKTHTCPRTANCIDTIGAFQCQCRSGLYVGNGWNCTGEYWLATPRNKTQQGHSKVARLTHP